jgi:uncharacterized membrane protein
MWAVLALELLGGLVLCWVGWRSFSGKLPRQRVAGIRTGYTLSSDERWNAVHRHGGPYLVFGGVAVTAAALAALPFAIAGALPEGFTAAVILANAFLAVGSAVAAWKIGSTRARAELGD